MLQAMSIDKWSLLTNAITLLVITATAVAALIQLRHLRAQNTLNAELAILKDWNDPQFRQWRLYVAGEMQTKIKDPAFLAEYQCSGSRPLAAPGALCLRLARADRLVFEIWVARRRRPARRYLNLDQSVMESARACN